MQGYYVGCWKVLFLLHLRHWPFSFWFRTVSILYWQRMREWLEGVSGLYFASFKSGFIINVGWWWSHKNAFYMTTPRVISMMMTTMVRVDLRWPQQGRRSWTLEFVATKEERLSVALNIHSSHNKCISPAHPKYMNSTPREKYTIAASTVYILAEGKLE